MPVAGRSFSAFFISRGLRKYIKTTDNTQKAITRINIFDVIKDNSAHIKAAIAKFKKNIAGVNISRIKNIKPIIKIICHMQKYLPYLL